jgi:hypothetical protein
VLLLRLRVRLDESVRAWFDDPRLPDASLRRLLNHTSGIPDPSGRTARSSGTAAAGRGPRRLPSSCFGNGPMIAVVLSDDSELPAETRAHELLTAAIRDGR